MGPTWGPPGPCRSQMGPMLFPPTLLSGDAQGLVSDLGLDFFSDIQLPLSTYGPCGQRHGVQLVWSSQFWSWTQRENFSVSWYRKGNGFLLLWSSLTDAHVATGYKCCSLEHGVGLLRWHLGSLQWFVASLYENDQNLTIEQHFQ